MGTERLGRYEVRYIADGDEFSAGSVETLSEQRILARAIRLRLGVSSHDRRVWLVDHEPGAPSRPVGGQRGGRRRSTLGVGVR